LIGDGRGGVFCENSLNPPREWHPVTQSKIALGSFDVLLTNPPFGAKIPIKGAAVLSQFDLGYRWERDKSTKHQVAVMLLRKEKPSATAYDLFMSDVKWCGHDSRGNPTLRKNSATGKIELLDEVPLVAARYQALVAGDTTRDHLGFLLRSDAMLNRILVPKYYDPEIEADLVALEATHRLVKIGELQKSKAISLDTGIEIGKMAYGTGTIPFIRTSDLSNWEIKADFKHGISQDIYDDLKDKIDVKVGDILLVRDGTYLIGTSAIVTEADLPMLFQSHIYRIRSLKPKTINPWLLFAALDSPIAKRQIRAKQFTQDIIDTIGKRLTEVVIPIPKDAKLAARIAAETKEVIESRAALRNRAKVLVLELQGLSDAKPEDLEVLAEI
jgi:type I restriction enzyme M protein